jgi:hypothetical protein
MAAARKEERFPPLNVELLVARHIAALKKKDEQNGAVEGEHQTHNKSPSEATTPTPAKLLQQSSSSPRKKCGPVDLQYVTRPTASWHARQQEVEAERNAAKTENSCSRPASSCGGGGQSEGGECPPLFVKLFESVKTIPQPPPVSRTIAEPARRKDYADRHAGKEIAAVINPDAASKRFYEQELEHRKLRREQQKQAEVDAVKKFRGARMTSAAQEQQVMRLSDESLKQQESALEALREQYFKKYAAINVTPRRSPRKRVAGPAKENTAKEPPSEKPA